MGNGTCSGSERSDGRLPRHPILCDWNANPHDYKSRSLLILFRMTQRLMSDLDRPRRYSYPMILLYRFYSEWLLGIEIRPKTQIGPALSVYHGYGIVINNEAVIGSHVSLRHGVTIGHKEQGGKSPTVGSYVQFGAHATVLGEISVGDHTIVGAGVVLTKSVPEGSTVRVARPQISDRQNYGGRQ